jgi:hypothetical protein
MVVSPRTALPVRWLRVGQHVEHDAVATGLAQLHGDDLVEVPGAGDAGDPEGEPHAVTASGDPELLEVDGPALARGRLGAAAVEDDHVADRVGLSDGQVVGRRGGRRYGGQRGGDREQDGAEHHAPDRRTSAPSDRASASASTAANGAGTSSAASAATSSRP